MKLSIIEASGPNLVLTSEPLYYLNSNAGTQTVLCYGHPMTMPVHRLPEVVSITKTSKPIIENEITKAVSEVEDLWKESADYNKPVTNKTMANAVDFLNQLAVHFVVPTECSYYDNGDIGFDWENEKGSLSILVDEKNIYFFHKSKSGNRRKGSDSWTGRISSEILVYMNRLFTKNDYSR